MLAGYLICGSTLALTVCACKKMMAEGLTSQHRSLGGMGAREGHAGRIPGDAASAAWVYSPCDTAPTCRSVSTTPSSVSGATHFDTMPAGRDEWAASLARSCSPLSRV